MKRQVFALAVAVLVLTSVRSAEAGSVIWGIGGAPGNVTLTAVDSATGLLIPGQQFLVPNLTAREGIGRAVAVLGNDIYYTAGDSSATSETNGDIYKTNAITHADLGLFASTGFGYGVVNLSTDGTLIYASDWGFTGLVKKYDTSGNLVGSVNVGDVSFRDGFQVQNNPNLDGGATTFISNRGEFRSNVYDVYKSDGRLLVSAFIDPSRDGFFDVQHGIAYDGNHYFVSGEYSRLLEYDGLGVFVGIIDLRCNPAEALYLFELSALGNTVNNPECGSQVQCLPLGDPNKCVFVNPGSITVHKTVDAGGASANSFCFTLSPDPGIGQVCAVGDDGGDGDFGFTGSGDAVFSLVPPGGPYDVLETDGPAGYHEVSNTCTGLMVVDGDELTCDVHDTIDTIDAIPHDVSARLKLGLGPIILGESRTAVTDVTARCRNKSEAEPVRCSVQVSGLPSECTVTPSSGDFLLDDTSSYEMGERKQFDFQVTTSCTRRLARGEVFILEFKACADGGILDPAHPCEDADLTAVVPHNVVVKSKRLRR